jgi:hypothetical protein
MNNHIIPDPQDFLAVESEYGKLSANASDEQKNRHYCLALTLKLIRLYDHGRLPLNIMREMDRIRERYNDAASEALDLGDGWREASGRKRARR